MYAPKANWAKFCQICTLLECVNNYIEDKKEQIEKEAEGKTFEDRILGSYYYKVAKFIEDNPLNCNVIGTTNYTNILKQIVTKTILKENDKNDGNKTDPKKLKSILNKICYLNGSTELLYDPYLNKTYPATIKDKDNKETVNLQNHILVPLLYTQSGTKAMTSCDQIKKYAQFINGLNDSNTLVVIGYGFNECDDNINSMIREFISLQNKSIVVISDLKLEEINKEELSLEDAQKLIKNSIDDDKDLYNKIISGCEDKALQQISKIINHEDSVNNIDDAKSIARTLALAKARAQILKHLKIEMNADIYKKIYPIDCNEVENYQLITKTDNDQ